jgi:serine/threonine protein kinase
MAPRPKTEPDERAGDPRRDETLANTVAETVAGTVAGPPSTETPTREIEEQRELPTIVGSFAATTTGSETKAPASDEAETIVEGGKAEATGPELVKGTAGTEATGRTAGRPWKSPLSKAASRTQRDPVVGSAAQRATQPYAPSGAGHLAEGQLLADRYELVERLGKGGMGEVWKARHILLQGLRAIKVIKASISRDATFRQRFLKEGQTMMRVKHQGVVEVTDLDETRQNRELFMVMEYLKGRTIYDAIRSKEKPLAADIPGAVRVLREVALGMQRIHQERIVHKDLKSDNVLLVVGEDGLEHPKVIDFGLAKSLGDADAQPEADPEHAQSPKPYDPDLHTTLSGTLAYMAPEQFRNEPSSFQSDLYAFGVMAYEVFSGGDFPLPRGPLTHYMQLHQSATRPDVIAKKCPQIDPKLAAILDRCLAPEKAARPESFAKVAKDLEYWLQTPEREARRKKAIYTAAGASVVFGFLVWSLFFKGKTASLSNLAPTSSAVRMSSDAKTAYASAAALTPFVLTAKIEGKPDGPVLQVDGKSREAKSETKDGQLVVTADLGDLADGVHELAVRASSDAAPANLALEVDRAPPVVGAVTLSESVTTGGTLYTRADSPEVAVDLGEPRARIAEVFAVTKSGVRSPGERDPEGKDRYVIKGTAASEGPSAFDVVVRDLAGNETKKPFAYVRDIKKPRPTFADVFTCFALRNPPTPAREALWVRDVEGQKMRVTVDEPCDVTAKFGDLPEVTQHADAPGEVELAIPAVPADGFAATVVARDAAGNEQKSQHTVRVMPDVLRVMNIDTTDEMAIPTDGAHANESTVVIVARSYPIGPGLELWLSPLRDADGGEVANRTSRPVDLPLLRRSDEDKTFVFTPRNSDFPDGEYELSARLPSRPESKPLRLIADSAPPAVESVRVDDAVTKQVVAEGAWSLHADVVVTVVVSDLALRRIDLDRTKPEEPVAPGKNTYTFKKRLTTEGLSTLTLVLADAAGHTVERTVNVQADWTDPQIARLDTPRDGDTFTDVKEAVFKGACSESAYSLVVEGLPSPLAPANCVAAEFQRKFLLPATEGPVAVSVVAVDPSGRRSEPRVVRIAVSHVSTDLPDTVVWTTGVKAAMQKVEKGDVVIGGRVRSVGLVFVGKTEVTNAEYRAFLAAAEGRHGEWCHPSEPKGWDHTPAAATWSDAKWNADDLPVVNVAWWDAYAFANWSGRRLPTEAEWVKAAAKSKSADETELRSWPPFGPKDDWKAGVLVTSESAKGPISALDGADVSPAGCLHMGGNVAEWVDLPEPVDGLPAGTRGGSWFFTRRAADVRNTPAKAYDRSFRANTIGMRCAVDASRVQP